MERYELQKLRELPIEGVAERLGLRVMRHKSLCPFHADHSPSLSFYRRNNTFRCFVCGAHGNTIDLVMHYLGKSFIDACQWLANENCIILTEYKPCEKEEKENAFNPERYIRFFEHPFLNDAAHRFLFDERKLNPRVISWCRLTSWTDKNGTSWLQIPYFDINGNLKGIQNRNLNYRKEKDMVRFRFPKGSHCGIYNLPVLKLLKPGEPLYIAEGCSDCWALLSSGRKAIAIPSATLLKAEEIKLLKGILQADSSPFPTGEGRGEAVTFHMYPDQDEPGERLYLELKELLGNVEHHSLPSAHKDFGSWWASMQGNLTTLTPYHLTH